MEGASLVIPAAPRHVPRLRFGGTVFHPLCCALTCSLSCMRVDFCTLPDLCTLAAVGCPEAAKQRELAVSAVALSLSRSPAPSFRPHRRPTSPSPRTRCTASHPHHHTLTIWHHILYSGNICGFISKSLPFSIIPNVYGIRLPPSLALPSLFLPPSLSSLSLPPSPSPSLPLLLSLSLLSHAHCLALRPLCIHFHSCHPLYPPPPSPPGPGGAPPSSSSSTTDGIH